MDVLPFIAEGVRVIGWALVHFSWECGIAGLLYWFARGLMPRGDARYRLGMTLLIPD